MLLYNSSNLNLGLRITLIDQFSGPADRIKTAFKGLKDEKALFEANARAGRDMYRGLAMAGAAATVGMGAAYATGAKFEYAIRGAAAASQATKEEFAGLKDEANKLGGDTMFTPREIAGSMNMLAKAGYSANEIMTATGPIINLAGAAMEDISVSADVAISTMYQYGLAATDMTKISDLLTSASLGANITLREVGESLKYASATAVDLSQDLPTVLSLIMTLGNAGMKGSMAGVGIENMYRYLSMGMGEFAKTGKVKAWQKIGIDPKQLIDSTGKMKPLVEILGILKSRIETFQDYDQQNILLEIFGVRGKRPPSKFLQELGQITAHMDTLQNSGGKAAKQLQFMMEGPEGERLKLLSVLESLANTFTEVIAPIVIPIMQGLNHVVRAFGWIMNSWIGSGLTRFVAGLIVVKTITWGVKAAVMGISMALRTMGGTVLGMKAAYIASFNQMTAATAQLAGAQQMLRPGGGVMGYAQAGSRLRQTTTGRFYKLGIGPGGSHGGGARFVSTAVGKRYMQMHGARSVAGAVGRGGAGMVARGALGFIGGPVGLGILGISIALPLLIKAFQKNTESNEAVTSANEDASFQSRRMLSMLSNEFAGLKNVHIRRMYHESGYGADNTNAILQERLNEYLENPKAFGGRAFHDYSNPDELHIYLDGRIEQKIQRQINKTINTELTFK